MSSGNINENSVTFEISNDKTVGRFLLARLEGNSLMDERILMRMSTQGLNLGGSLGSVESSTSITLDKRQTKVLSTIFKEFAKVMDEWYKEEEK